MNPHAARATISDAALALLREVAQAEENWLRAEVAAGRIDADNAQWFEWSACGHRAVVPASHDSNHRHYCPVCDPGEYAPGCAVDYHVSPRGVTV